MQPSQSSEESAGLSSKSGAACEFFFCRDTDEHVKYGFAFNVGGINELFSGGPAETDSQIQAVNLTDELTKI